MRLMLADIKLMSAIRKIMFLILTPEDSPITEQWLLFRMKGGVARSPVWTAGIVAARGTLGWRRRYYASGASTTIVTSMFLGLVAASA